MEWVEERKTTFCDVVEQDKVSNSSQNGYKRNSSMSEYLKNEKEEVIFGGYTPSVTDGTKLSQRFSETRSLPHAKEEYSVQNGTKTVPICIGLLSVDNIIPPSAFFSQVKKNENHFFVQVNYRWYLHWCQENSPCGVIHRLFI